MSDAAPVETPAEPAKTQADETRVLKTYEDAQSYISAALQSGADSKLLAPLLAFFKERIERAPQTRAEPDEDAIKRAQLSKRVWKPYSAKASVEAPAPELKI